MSRVRMLHFLKKFDENSFKSTDTTCMALTHRALDHIKIILD